MLNARARGFVCLWFNYESAAPNNNWLINLCFSENASNCLIDSWFGQSAAVSTIYCIYYLGYWLSAFITAIGVIIIIVIIIITIFSLTIFSAINQVFCINSLRASMVWLITA